MTSTPRTGAASAASAWHCSPQEYAANRKIPYTVPTKPESLYVAAGDGTRLAVDVYLPQSTGNSAGGTFPSILIFTPYYRRFDLHHTGAVDPSPNTAKYRDLFTPHGYAVVVVDVRGTGASFGNREGFRSPVEIEDSKDIVDWVIAQPWSNGDIGATGISYLGAAAEFLANTGHPAVKAIAPLFSVWDTYENNYFPGGVQLNDLIESYGRLMIGLDQDDRSAIAPFAAYADPEFNGPAPVDADVDCSLRDAAVREHGNNYRHSDMMREFSFREEPLPYDPSYSSANFSPYSYTTGCRDDVAIYSISGWMDGAGYTNGAITRFLTKTKNPHHLLIGPWDHGARSDVSPWRLSPNADGFWWSELLRFFDHYLLGMDTGLEREAPVHYFSIHAEAWRPAQDWPLSSQSDCYVLTADRALEPRATAVSDRQSGLDDPPSTVTYRADLTVGTGKNTRYERIAGQSVTDYYADWQGRTAQHLCFTSAPVEHDCTISGHGVATLFLSLSDTDATVFVYLTEIEQDGTERYITEGLLRLLHRRETTATDDRGELATDLPNRTFRKVDSAPVVPNTTERIRIPLLPTSWTISVGSKIRLSIAGADADHATQSPHGRRPTITVDTDGNSMLTLPVER